MTGSGAFTLSKKGESFNKYTFCGGMGGVLSQKYKDESLKS